jgi:hypothetical protein
MKMRKKSDLPSKLCFTCGLPFTWRKKWEKVWSDVKYCSERCRRGNSGGNSIENNGSNAAKAGDRR